MNLQEAAVRKRYYVGTKKVERRIILKTPKQFCLSGKVGIDRAQEFFEDKDGGNNI